MHGIVPLSIPSELKGELGGISRRQQQRGRSFPQGHTQYLAHN
jgi:hypothetical protein